MPRHDSVTTGRGRWMILGLAVGLLLALSMPAGAARWQQKVTGGGLASAGSTQFSLTMSASDVGGQWQYDRSDLTMHGTIDCVYVAPDQSYAVMSGLVTHVSEGIAFAEGQTVKIAVLEGGKGSGDRVRIWADSSGCGPYGGPYPGIYHDGNVTIRTR